MKKEISYNSLIPEIAVLDIKTSSFFYVDILGFNIEYSRPEEGFYFLSLEGTQLMLEEACPTYSWKTAEFLPPLGVGVNFQITISSVDYILDRLKKNDIKLFRDCQESWYRVDDLETGLRQFLVQDPDGYLLRFVENIGMRTLSILE